MKNYLTHRNNDLFDEAFDSFFRPFYVDQESSFMKTDIKETEKEYALDVEMPGFEKKDITLNFENGYLTISAKKESASDNTRYIRRERAMSCSRSFYMGDVDETKIKAKYESGVLFVTVPKESKEETKHAINID
ncbi:MAG: Hsp20/alpha crystallin family protein [Corallococcus sp.]|nr:Hsp20/alpha crystallin family protein [Bacillota bacterium]MCM1533446.1 Hsp20/alpha crystallin family protein [Corallococcus sp.]